ncbi:MAG: hypothetical protein NT160_01770, partial [Actinobacteria bacterium]|nr:hypothetical protein [Actinomycetota bacterium]
MTITKITHPGASALRVGLLPIERRRLLDLGRASQIETERRLFFKLLDFDNGAPPTPVLFTENEIALLCGLADCETPS